jgi:hypothetical protein
MKITLATVGVISLACSLASAGIQAPGNLAFVGTWKFNLAKSNYGSFQAPRSAMRTIEDRGNGEFKEDMTVVTANGAEASASLTMSCDGKDYPFTQRVGERVSDKGLMSCSVRDAHTFEFSVKGEGGKLLNKFVRTLSEDGSTLTDTISSANPNGPENTIVSIFDRQ